MLIIILFFFFTLFKCLSVFDVLLDSRAILEYPQFPCVQYCQVLSVSLHPLCHRPQGCIYYNQYFSFFLLLLQNIPWVATVFVLFGEVGLGLLRKKKTIAKVAGDDQLAQQVSPHLEGFYLLFVCLFFQLHVG